MKKNRSLIFILILLIISICAIGGFLIFDYISQLENQISKRDKTINQLTQNDAIFDEKTKKYSEVINNYVDDCNFTMDGKVVSSSELTDMLYDYMDQNYVLEDSLSELIYNQSLNSRSLCVSQDSLSVLKNILYQLEEDYGIKYIVNRESNYYVITSLPSKVDTAMVLFPYYKDRIWADSSGKHLIVRKPESSIYNVPVTKETRKKKKKKENNNFLKSR